VRSPRRRAYLESGRRGGKAAAAVLLLATTLGACTAARNTLGTTTSPCFDALAVASAAVHHHGTFDGVRLMSLDSLGKAAHLREDILADAGPGVHDICAVGYHGTFTVKSVKRPLGRPPPGGVGHFAVVIVSKPQNHLVGTLVRVKEPLRFQHSV
jgi:hypothetical protein